MLLKTVFKADYFVKRSDPLKIIEMGFNVERPLATFLNVVAIKNIKPKILSLILFELPNLLNL